MLRLMVPRYSLTSLSRSWGARPNIEPLSGDDKFLDFFRYWQLIHITIRLLV
jgi:hypothetical protein